MIHTDFVNENDLLIFLQSNTMNIFLYDNLHGRGISSTIDYALSVRRPLGISDSFMFRHIYSDEICLYKNSIQKADGVRLVVRIPLQRVLLSVIRTNNWIHCDGTI